MYVDDSRFQKYKIYTNICGGSSGSGRQMTVGWLMTTVLGYLGGYSLLLKLVWLFHVKLGFLVSYFRLRGFDFQR